jgi:hypothetical protein
MRKLLLLTAVLALGVIVGCDTKSPTGPSTVTIETPTPTTTIPPGGTTVPPTTTSIPTPATTRSYVAFGATAPTVPSQLTLVLTPLSGRPAAASFFDRLPFVGKQQDELWSVLGFYRTPSGTGGQITGELVGTLDAGTFTGTLTADSPECVAERQFSGTVDPQLLRWTGGTTLRDCKGNPLAFNTLTMLATSAPPPTTPPPPTTSSIPLQCSYALSISSDSVPATGGPRTVGVVTGPTCGWSVQNFVDWITVQPTTGTGPGTVTITVAPNAGAPRTATVVIAGLPFVVNQGIVTTTTTTTTIAVALADLQPVTVDGSFCTVNDSFNLRVAVRNSGAAAAGSFFTRVFFDSGTSPISSQDRLTAGLAANTTTEMLFPIPGSCDETCTIQIIADINNAIQESNEADNTVGVTCLFGGADVVTLRSGRRPSR